MHIICARWPGSCHSDAIISSPWTLPTTTRFMMESNPKEHYRATPPQDGLAEAATNRKDEAGAGSAAPRDEDRPRPETVRGSRKPVTNKKTTKRTLKKPSTQTSHAVRDVHAVQDTTNHDSDSKPENCRKRRRGSRSSPRKPKTTMVLDSDEEYADDDGTARKTKRKNATKAPGRGPEEARTCPHCQKVCSTKYGLKYHLGMSKTGPAKSFRSNISSGLHFQLFPWKITLYVDLRRLPTPWLLIQSANEGSTTKQIPRLIPSAFADLPRIEHVLTAVVFSQVNWVATITLVRTWSLCALLTDCFANSLIVTPLSPLSLSASQSIRFASQSTPQMVPRAYEMPKIRGWVPCSQDPGSSLNMVSHKL